ncbi:hypothetical protein J5Y03_10230 [Bacillus sp. RG28]|uniref:Uncharacterized protein n=1 Tax=Gottfriedia endophytica TaxID=2820819 RepID=A0A940NPW6_9BACI|nr:hypothetical protein [Gottfriedia endophytica]MBP0725565.1 hypothetical protein [Gottfriedia endophytica]
MGMYVDYNNPNHSDYKKLVKIEKQIEQRINCTQEKTLLEIYQLMKRSIRIRQIIILAALKNRQKNNRCIIANG